MLIKYPQNQFKRYKRNYKKVESCKLLTKFNYVLLIVGKFMGTGCYKDPNLYKLAEYYSNIFYIILKLDSGEINEELFYKNLFTNYQDFKTKLIYSIMELGINSDTIDEIINFIDDIIIQKFLEKKISI